MNADHADALALYATRLARPRAGGAWRATGLDPDGLDLAAAATGRRGSPFPDGSPTPGAIAARVLKSSWPIGT